VRLKQALDAEIQRLTEAGYTGFLSGMAEGTDTWAALSVLALREKRPGIKLHCVLPCEGQDAGWSETARRLYRSILERADHVTYVNREYHKGCMLERNRYLVEHASCLLAVYNGERRGGTAATVRYARKLGREIVLIGPEVWT